MKYKEAIDCIVKYMQEELPDKLRYHSLEHTLGVLHSSEYIGKKHQLTTHEFELLLTAAAYHDSGFTRTYKGHEEVGCDIVREFLPKFDYNQEEIDTIEKMIRSTKIPQSPTTLSEKILCDADLDYLGGGKYDEISESLFDELGLNGVKISDGDWLNMQITFLEAHHYWTDFAIEILKPKKEKILHALKAQKAKG